MPLPQGYEWYTCSIEDVITFMNQPQNETFRYGYTRETLWWCTDQTLAIRKIKSKEIVGYIHADRIYMNDDTSFLIDEMKQRVPNGIVVTKRPCWHRFLNVKKLVRLGFYKTNRVRDTYYEIRGPCVYTWRRMVEEDIPKVSRMLKMDVRQLNLPIHSYVDDTSDVFVSFYTVPYERIDGSGTVNQSFCLCTIGTNVINDACILAKNTGSDVLTFETKSDMKCMEGNLSCTFTLPH